MTTQPGTDPAIDSEHRTETVHQRRTRRDDHGAGTQVLPHVAEPARGHGAWHPLRPGGFTARDRRCAARLPARPDVTAMGTLGLVRATIRPAGRGASGAVHWTRAVLRTWWRNRAARCELLRCARLDPRFASDIGLTQGDVAMAVRTPFWVSVQSPDRFGGRS